MSKIEKLDQQYQRLISDLEVKPHFFNPIYLSDLPLWNNFLDTFSLNKKAKTLELGCGPWSSFSVMEKISFTGLELSKVACDYAHEVKIIHGDVLDLGTIFKEDELFDLIIDSHLFHNLDNLNDIESALSLSLKKLEQGGLLIGELPVAHNHYIHNCEKIVLTSREWEELLLKKATLHDAYLGYFTISLGDKMILDSDGLDGSREALPSDADVLRYIIVKN